MHCRRSPAPLPFDWLLSEYPSEIYLALTATFEKFTPSYTHIFDDATISYEFGLLIANSYVPDRSIDTEANHYLSPLYTPADILEKYPPTTIFVGDADPLHDCAVRFALKMK
jgi:acetyl esterase/lipase